MFYKKLLISIIFTSIIIYFYQNIIYTRTKINKQLQEHINKNYILERRLNILTNSILKNIEFNEHNLYNINQLILNKVKHTNCFIVFIPEGICFSCKKKLIYEINEKLENIIYCLSSDSSLIENLNVDPENVISFNNNEVSSIDFSIGYIQNDYQVRYHLSLEHFNSLPSFFDEYLNIINKNRGQ